MPFLFRAILAAAVGYSIHLLARHLRLASRHRRFKAENGCKPVKIWQNKDPLLGLDFLWDAYKSMTEHRALLATQERYGRAGTNTVQLRLLGQSILSTIEPENLKTILSLRFKDYQLPMARKKLLVPFLGEGIFTMDGTAWQHSRDMLRPNFARNQVGDIDMFERHVGNLIQAIPRDGTTIDLQDLFISLTLDVATEFLFGKSTSCLDAGAADAALTDFVQSFTYCQNFISAADNDQGFLGLFLPNRRMKGHIKVVQGFVDSIIKEASIDQAAYESEKQNSPRARYIFLFELLSQTNDVVRIRSELLNILLAGRDTTASLLSNVWWELSRRPDVWAGVQQEVRALEGKMPSFEELKSMKYLQAVNNETLRLYPVLPENEREAICDTVLPVGGGDDQTSPVFVGKGQLAHWSVFTMHRRKDIYGDDAEDFRPDRWIDHGETKGLRVSWDYLPFNGGPRVCIGQQFALTESSYITVRLMQEFSRIESQDSEPWREKLTLTCTGLGGCKVILRP